MSGQELKINETLGISQEDIVNKKYNLWIGISLGNKWFSRDNTEELIKFGLRHTRDSLLIWVPGRLFATNLRYFENLSRAQSLKKSFEIGDDKIREIKEIVASLSESDQRKIIIANYDDTLTSGFVKQREVLLREFAQQGTFYDSVMEISEEALVLRDRTITKERCESVSLYTLQELPAFLDGLSKIDSDIMHTVIIYPGTGKLDRLVMQIINDDTFASLRDKLLIRNRVGIASIQ